MNIGWQHLPALQVGDIVHVHSHTWLGDLIRWAERTHREAPSWASHTGMVYRQAGPYAALIEAYTRVIVRPVDAYQYEAADVLITRHTQPPLTPAQQGALYETVQALRGARYGYVDLLAHFGDALFSKWTAAEVRWLRDVLADPPRPICSWLVAYAYARSHRIHFHGKLPRYVQPDDILDHCMQSSDWTPVWCSSDQAWDRVQAVYNPTQGRTTCEPSG